MCQTLTKEEYDHTAVIGTNHQLAVADALAIRQNYAGTRNY